MLMASVMAIGSEVFGSCVGEIDVSAGMQNRDVRLCCGWNYLGFVLTGKAAKDWGNRWGWCQILDGFWGFWSYWRNKKPLWWQGLLDIR